MTVLIQKLSKLRFAAVIRVALALFIVVFGAGVTLAQTQQVSFTATGTAVITGVTKLPGGLTQLTGTVSGNATHLGDVTGPITRIQDNQGNFGTTEVFIAANGKDSIFLSVSGTFQGKGGGDKCVITSTGTYTITGGTGAFANATGSGTIATTIDLCAGTAIGTYTGTISQPNSN
ncbi:MAG: hypothetical protein LAO76_23780 [Acidobacteriia bacterium]|nr:hypothetical protein [Terriglobia bacterium]